MEHSRESRFDSREEDTIEERIGKLIDEELDTEDREYLEEEGMDPLDAIGYIYGRLLEKGRDPDEVLKEYGVTE